MYLAIASVTNYLHLDGPMHMTVDVGHGAGIYGSRNTTASRRQCARATA